MLKFEVLRLGFARVKEIHRVVGVSCVGYEDQFIALLTVIEASHIHKVSTYTCKLGNKGSRELKRMECSINYDP